MTAKKKGPHLPKGRPSGYVPEYDDLVRRHCLLGATDEDIARFFDISVATVTNWKRDHPSFLAAIKEGREVADAEVASKLFKRATGYSHKAVKIASTPDGREHITEYDERFPPETAAMIFWLKNRRPDLWRDKIDNTHSGPDGGNVKVEVIRRVIVDGKP